MYNDNPTLKGLTKVIDEQKQGEVFFKQQAIADAGKKKFYIESYGCQMNFSDSEIVASILGEAGFVPTRDMEQSDLILINTCSIRERAEDTVRKRLRIFDKIKRKRPGTLIGVLGCMAERLKEKLLDQEKLVDIVIGPDAYRDLPKLVATAEDGEKGVNVLLSRERTRILVQCDWVQMAFLPLFPSCGVVIICVHFALCRSLVGENVAGIPLAL
jgi:tRNA-2-methylthio-N6-dimethylallyladenosine synthase